MIASVHIYMAFSLAFSYVALCGSLLIPRGSYLFYFVLKGKPDKSFHLPLFFNIESGVYNKRLPVSLEFHDRQLEVSISGNSCNKYCNMVS